VIQSEGADKEPKHLTAKQAAEMIGVHPDTIKEWARNKMIPAFKLTYKKGSSWRFSVDKLKAWVDLRTTGQLK
jgi:excisionase family DNA binding protein